MPTSRRHFLKASLGASALASFASGVPGFLARALAAAQRAQERDTVLVVVQLTGGNDGLNTVVPFTDDVYGRSRSTLRLPAATLHRISADLGFHPDMKEFRGLFDEELLSIVQGVGYPRQDRDHDGAMRAWHTADCEARGAPGGWLGRAADLAWNVDGPGVPAAFVGSIPRPFGLSAEATVVPALRSLEELVLREAQEHGSSPSDNPLLEHVRAVDRRARSNSLRLEPLARQDSGAAGYPSFSLAQDLHQAARLIEADIGVRIIYCELGGGGIGGFDNHANQLGNHCALLRQLAESVAAFMRDLRRIGALPRVLLMTFSEFGRTVSENGRRGTGHGEAAPLFLVGGGLKGGLAGPHPSLTDLVDDAPKHHTDFRRVYATVLEKWLGFDARAVLGEEFAPLDLLRP
ncbi:MAG: DUF1501 domain-containing protein [Planctomycetes bacterium]|nr:DUF1501 domain-containing protein [Planctomycetota bacterium]